MSARVRSLGQLVAVLGCAAAAARVWEQSSLGFPDGHLTELEAALRTPHRLMVAAILLAALALGVRSDRRALMALVTVLVLADWIVVPLIGALLGLEHGGGG